LIKRNQSLKILDAGEPRQSGKESKIAVTLKEGISQEHAKKIGKLIRDEGPKGVKVQVQGDELRVSSKKRDDLQAVIALVKEQDYDFAVQCTNYRGAGGVRPARASAADGVPLHATGVRRRAEPARRRVAGDRGEPAQAPRRAPRDPVAAPLEVGDEVSV